MPSQVVWLSVKQLHRDGLIIIAESGEFVKGFMEKNLNSFSQGLFHAMKHLQEIRPWFVTNCFRQVMKVMMIRSQIVFDVTGKTWYSISCPREILDVDEELGKTTMKLLLDVARGVVIGLANLIPGVSGGTMMVSMGIYDTLIGCITHLFKQFRQSVMTLLPYALGMALAIVFGAVGLKAAFARFPLPTNTLFIGLILGSVPMILKEMKGQKTGLPGAIAFIALFALVVGLKLAEADNTVEITLSVGEVIKLFALGCIASATMVIPGVSGSMILKTLGYYEPIVTGAVAGLVSALGAGDWALIGHQAAILLPFGIGVVVGIFAIAKLIEALLARWKGVTYCAIMGMVVASPVVILMDGSIYAGLNGWTIAAGIVSLALGCLIALRLGGNDNTKEETHA